MTKRYMEIAIKMPVEIAADGSTRLMDEYMRVEYTKCDGLPEKNENDFEKHKAMYSHFVNSIKKEFQYESEDLDLDEQEDLDEDLETAEVCKLVIEPKEIKNGSHTKRQNTSFKRHRSHSAKYTQRNHR